MSESFDLAFNSFIMAGFECTYALAQKRRRLDLLAATRHDQLVEDDYQMIKEAGILSVREGLAWHQIDKGSGQYDFSRFTPLFEAGQKLGIQQIWDLNHFDYPEDLDPFSSAFVERFANYAQAVVTQLRQYSSNTLYIVPVNEISFFAWIGSDKGWWAPYKRGRGKGTVFKSQLVRAAIAAMNSIWQVESNVRFIHVDPFMRRLATEPASKTAQRHVKEFNEIIRFQAWDMLAGKVAPELGGDPKYLDIIGVNYYIHNQEWVHSVGSRKLQHQQMDWESTDRISFAYMLKEVYERYKRPVIITETGSFGENRVMWWDRTLQQIDEALQMKLPVYGVCAYPVLDRPESAGFLLPNSGLWDFRMDDEHCQRVPHERVIKLIKSYNQKWSSNFSTIFND